MEIIGIVGTLVMLIALQVVLGFDNLLYIALESKKAPIEKQEFVRKIGITIAIILRLALLFILVNLVEKFKNPFLISESKFISFEMNLHSLIILFGGVPLVVLITNDDITSYRRKLDVFEIILSKYAYFNVRFSFTYFCIKLAKYTESATYVCTLHALW